MTTLQVYGPFANGGFDGLLRGLLTPERAARTVTTRMRIDVIERDNAYVVRADVPGVRKDDIQVTIEGAEVTIAADVKPVADAKDGEVVLRSERYQGPLHRTFVLPVEIDEAASEARYEAGVLELTMTKKVQQAGRKLTIQ
jgi:HSP20 family protein